ncbi:MAG: glycosyltransferase family 2 protein [Betaproteobacteria bacterium]|nr:MAG: glycosyltransferase family 2 protein [Betaproteobacteria bacterium]
MVIVNWNSGRQLSECLQSVSDFDSEIVGKIFVVDNASSDGSQECAQATPGVCLIQAQENLGFAKACNLAARQGHSAYCLFLNPDARLYEGSIGAVLQFMESPEAAEIGICGIRLVDSEGRTHRHCARFPSWRTYFGKVSGLSRLFPQRFPPHFMIEFDHETSREVDQVSGACFFVRRKVSDDIGWFDERFFVYMEELDFCFRAKRAGWRTWYTVDATAYHRGGGTSEQVKAQRLFYSLRSRVLYGFKHFSPTAAWSVFVVTMGFEPLARVFRGAFRLSFEEIRDTCRAYLMLWRGIPGIFRAKRFNR